MYRKMSDDSVKGIQEQLEGALSTGVGPKIARYALAVLSGVIPYAGGVVGGIGSAWSEKEQADFNKLLSAWLKMQEDEIKEIGKTLIEIMVRLDQSDQKIKERIESPEYLRLIKRAFRDWSAAESEEKRVLIRNLLVNAASTQICTDDVISLFIQWIDKYSEAHFRVIREVFNNAGITRLGIWSAIHSDIAREDSADADLFKLLIQDLTMGHVIRQHREVDYAGNFIPKQRQQSAVRGTRRQYKSAFDDEEQYELTDLGSQFVSYTMNEVVPKIGSPKQ